MDKKLILITPEDEVKNAPYEGYKDVSNGVDGVISRLTTLDIETPIGNIECDVYCNDCFLIEDRFDKCNAIATILTGTPIYGNVVILQRDGLDRNKGFEYFENEEGEEDLCECWFVEDRIMLYANRNRDVLKEVHESLDKNKPEPTFEVRSHSEAEIG